MDIDLETEAEIQFATLLKRHNFSKDQIMGSSLVYGASGCIFDVRSTVREVIDRLGLQEETHAVFNVVDRISKNICFTLLTRCIEFKVVVFVDGIKSKEELIICSEFNGTVKTVGDCFDEFAGCYIEWLNGCSKLTPGFLSSSIRSIFPTVHISIYTCTDLVSIELTATGKWRRTSKALKFTKLNEFLKALPDVTYVPVTTDAYLRTDKDICTSIMSADGTFKPYEGTLVVSEKFVGKLFFIASFFVEQLSKLNATHIENLKHYRNIDAEKNSILEAYFSVINDIHSRPFSNACQTRAFGFIGAPSFEGKTQLTYTMDQYSRHPAKDIDTGNYYGGSPKFAMVLRFAMAPVGRDQPINEADVYATALHNSLKYDLMTVKETLKIENEQSLTREQFVKLNARRLSSTSLANSGLSFRTLGLLARIIVARKSGTEFKAMDDDSQEIKFTSLTIQEFRGFVEREWSDDPEDMGLPFVIFLDEFNASSFTDDYMLACYLARNLCKASGPVTFTCGTDLTAHNLASHMPIYGSRDTDGFIWVYVFNHVLPATIHSMANSLSWMDKPEFLAAFENDGLQHFRNWICQTRRSSFAWKSSTCLKVCTSPGMLEIFLDFMEKRVSESVSRLARGKRLDIVPLMDNALRETLAMMKVGKGGTDIFRIGQILIFFPNNRLEEIAKDTVLRGDFVHGHVAKLVSGQVTSLFPHTSLSFSHDRIIELRNSKNGLTEGQNTGTTFKPFSAYFPYPFDELLYITMSGWIDVLRFRPTEHSMATMLKFNREKYSSYRLENYASLRPDFNLFEVAILAGAIVSTHRSLSGLKFEEYLLNFLNELSKELGDVQKIEGLDLISEFMDVQVPYVPVANSKPSKRLTGIPGVYMGYLYRPKDAKMHYGLMVPIIPSQPASSNAPAQQAGTKRQWKGTKTRSQKTDTERQRRKAKRQAQYAKLLSFILECKDWCKNLTPGEVNKILKKNLKTAMAPELRHITHHVFFIVTNSISKSFKLNPDEELKTIPNLTVAALRSKKDRSKIASLKRLYTKEEPKKKGEVTDEDEEEQTHEKHFLALIVPLRDFFGDHLDSFFDHEDKTRTEGSITAECAQMGSNFPSAETSESTGPQGWKTAPKPKRPLGVSKKTAAGKFQVRPLPKGAKTLDQLIGKTAKK